MREPGVQREDKKGATITSNPILPPGPRCCSKPDCVRHGVLCGLKHRRSLVTRLVDSPSVFPLSGLPMQTTFAGCRSPTAKRDFRCGSFSDTWKCSSDVEKSFRRPGVSADALVLRSTSTGSNDFGKVFEPQHCIAVH